MPTKSMQLPQDADELPPLIVPGQQAPIPLDLSTGMAQRPLDPYGIDVPAEIPTMQRTFNNAGKGRAIARQGSMEGAGSGRQEVGYAMFKPDGPTGQVYHTAPQIMSGYHDVIKYPPSTAALFHTHPPGANQQPSPGDMQGSVDKHLPNYVYSENDKGVPSLYVTRPDKKAFDQYRIADWNLGKK